MVSLFTTKASLEDFYLNKSVWFQMICKLNRVFIDDDPFCDVDDESVDPDEDVFLTLDGMGIDINDEKDFINNIPDNPSSVLNYPCGIFLLDINDSLAKQIQKDYGVICQSLQNLDETQLTCNHRTAELEAGETGRSWSSVIDSFHSFPSNSLLVIDAHLFDNDRFDENANAYDSNRNVGIENLYEIINAILPPMFGAEYHVGVLLTDTDKAKASHRSRTNLSNARIAKAIQRLKRRLNRPYNIIFDVIFFDASDNDGHKLIHNRRIISNYFYVTALYKLAAFKNGASVEGDSITASPLFENLSNDDESDKKEKRMRSDLVKFKEFFSRQAKSMNPTACFLQDNRAMDAFVDMKHRLLKIS